MGKRLKEQVIAEVKRKKLGKDCEDLCKNIFEWYETGGNQNLKQQINNLVKTATKSFNQESDKARILTKVKKAPKKKKAKKRRR